MAWDTGQGKLPGGGDSGAKSWHMCVCSCSDDPSLHVASIDSSEFYQFFACFTHYFLDAPFCHCLLSSIVKRAMGWSSQEEEAGFR